MCPVVCVGCTIINRLEMDSDLHSQRICFCRGITMKHLLEMEAGLQSKKIRICKGIATRNVLLTKAGMLMESHVSTFLCWLYTKKSISLLFCVCCTIRNTLEMESDVHSHRICLCKGITLRNLLEMDAGL